MSNTRSSKPLQIQPSQQFGLWSVVREIEKRKGQRCFLCRCKCGTERAIDLRHLTTGGSKTCGCVPANFRHGHTDRRTRGRGTSEYITWMSMRARCRDPKRIDYARYGGRGITVCAAWQNSFEAFIADMGPKPAPKYTIERKDPDGNYTPENCRWATRAEQSRNKSKINTRAALVNV